MLSVGLSIIYSNGFKLKASFVATLAHALRGHSFASAL